jgi:hypothetical protein
MVFSVQQGEHGPLVVYKLQLPATTSPQSPAEARPTVPATVAPRLSPEQPTVLGTVFIPTPRAAAVPAPVPVPAESAAPVRPGMPDLETAYRIVADYSDDSALINKETGGYLTLQEVNDAVLWRRDTAEKLRQIPIAPRF